MPPRPPLPVRNVFLALTYRAAAVTAFAWLLALSWFKWWLSVPLMLIVALATLALVITVVAVLRSNPAEDDTAEPGNPAEG